MHIQLCCETEVCPPFLRGVVEAVGGEGKNVVPPSPLASVLPVRAGGKEEAGGDISVWQGDLLKERVCRNCSDRF